MEQVIRKQIQIDLSLQMGKGLRIKIELHFNLLTVFLLITCTTAIIFTPYNYQGFITTEYSIADTSIADSTSLYQSITMNELAL